MKQMLLLMGNLMSSLIFIADVSAGESQPSYINYLDYETGYYSSETDYNFGVIVSDMNPDAEKDRKTTDKRTCKRVYA